jgi:hypothetical protein
MNNSRRKLLINSGLLGLSLTALPIFSKGIFSEQNVRAKILEESLALQVSWNNTFNETTSHYLNTLPVDLFKSIQTLKDKVSNDFLVGETISVNGLILSKMEAALVLSVAYPN